MRRGVALAAVLAAAAALGTVLATRRGAAPPPPPPPPAGADVHGDPLPPYAVARMGTVRRPIASSGLAFSPDGRELVCGCGDGVVRRFDAATGALTGERRVRGGFRELPRRRGPFSWVTAAFDRKPDEFVADLPLQVAFSADGATVAAVGAGSASVHASRTTETLTRAGHDPLAAAVTPDGSGVAFGWDDGTVAFGTNPGSVSVASPVQAVALSPDGRLVAVQAQELSVFDVRTGGRLASVASAKDFSPRAVAFSPDGTRLVHAHGRSGLVLRDARTFDIVWEANAADRPGWGDATFSPDGLTIAWATDGVCIVDAATGAVVRVLDTGGVRTWRVAFAPDGSRIAATAAGVVRVWETATWTEVRPPAAPSSPVTAVEFSPDGRSLLSRGHGRCLDVWDAATGRLVGSLTADAWIGDAAWAPDSASVRCAIWRREGDTSLATFDVASGERTADVACPKYARFVMHGAEPMQIRYTPPPPGSGTWDLADPRTGASLRALGMSTLGGLNAVSRDGRFLVETAGSAPLGVVDLATGARAASGATWSLTSEGMTRLVALAPDASLVALAFQYGDVRVFERSSGTIRFSADSGLHGAATALAISPDGGLLAIGSPFGEVRVWTVADEREVLVLAGHRGAVWSLDFSPDGARLASGADDATVLVWDVSGLARPR